MSSEPGVTAEWLAAAVDGVQHVFTLDNHYLSHGQGELLAARMAERGLMDGTRVSRFGLGDFPACGANDEALRHHGLDAESLTERIGRALRDA